jgi:galactose mutarotase-like enzyme
LENEYLKISILPEKGADLFEFIYKPKGIDFLYKTSPGLQPPGNHPPVDVIENYEGGWQELFPNTGDACQYQGVHLPIHGEAALLPWDYTVVRDDADETRLLFTVQTRLLPFRLERQMTVQKGRPTLVIEEQVTNLSDVSLDFVWGHHLVLGGTFLEDGCRYQAPARTILVPDHQKQAAHARLAPGQKQPWPYALGRLSGTPVDLRDIPGPEIHSHDDVFLTDLERGEASIMNPRLGLVFSLNWDVTTFGCLVMWQPYGGLDVPPWAGSYGVGMEPWTTCSNLEGAVNAGKTLHLKPKETLSTKLYASVTLAS